MSAFCRALKFIPPLVVAAALLALPLLSPAALAQDKKPNIVIIWGDDIGQTNISAYSKGLMGYQTPNIDRIANEGMHVHRLLRRAELYGGPLLVHHGPSRSADGHDARSGCRAPPLACRSADVTIAELLKAQGYATGQFGKNHLGDRDEHLPTNHGFDEFYGNLYHLNAEEEPELPDYPKDSDFPNFRKKFGPRGVIHSWATAGRHTEDRGHRPADQEAHGDHRRRHRGARGRVHRETDTRPASRCSCG